MKRFSTTSSDPPDALARLRRDTDRFLCDHGLSGRFAAAKLLLVVDYWAVLHFRLCEFCGEGRWGLRRAIRPLVALAKPFVEGTTGCRLRYGASIGGGVLLHHSMGVAVAVGATVGDDCSFFSGVVVAHKADGRSNGAPKIGNRVKLMTGCKIIGNVTIGDDAVIGANAVVLCDVPAGCIAVGIPARVIPRDGRQGEQDAGL